MTWTQPICLTCSLRAATEGFHTWCGARHSWACCRCGAVTTAGVYIHINPASVPYPSED